MFKKCFSVEQIQKITRSKYANGIAVTTATGADDIIEAAKLAGVDLNLGLSPSQLREKKIERELMETAITFGQAEPGGLECHNFEEELSLTTLSSNRRDSGKSVEEGTMAKSMFSIVSSTGNGGKRLRGRGRRQERRGQPIYNRRNGLNSKLFRSRRHVRGSRR